MICCGNPKTRNNWVGRTASPVLPRHKYTFLLTSTGLADGFGRRTARRWHRHRFTPRSWVPGSLRRAIRLFGPAALARCPCTVADVASSGYSLAAMC